MSTDATLTNSISLSALTDVGKAREHNEDSFIVCPDLAAKNWYLVERTIPLSAIGSLLVVADGMGGANAGEVASELAVESIKQFFISLDLQQTPSEKQAKEHLREAILTAHENIVSHALDNPDCAGMGTTIILAWIMPAKAIIAWCGDSRGYFYRPGQGAKIITKDHSLVWEMVEAGKLSIQEADTHPDNNIITQSLGDQYHSPKTDFIIQALQSGDKLLLCSDGLNNMVSQEAIGIMLSQTKSLTDINRELIEAANSHGGKDNVTVLLAEIHEQSLVPVDTTETSSPQKKSVPLFFSLAGLLVVFLLWWTLGSSGTESGSGTMQVAGDEKNKSIQIEKETPAQTETADTNTLTP